MNEALLSRIQTQWRDAFKRFLESGDLEPGLEDYLNTNPEAQEVLDAAFQEQAGALGTLLKEASNPDFRFDETPISMDPDAVASVLKASLDMNNDQQERFFEEVGATLKAQIDRSQRIRLAHNLSRALPI